MSSIDYDDVSSLTVSSRPDSEGFLVEAVGDIDLHSAGVLEESLVAGVSEVAKSKKGRILKLDLRQVDFVDSAGLALLIKIRRDLEANDCPFHLILKTKSQPERVLKLGRFDALMSFIYVDSPR